VKILLTGATGFLGSHIAEELLLQNNELILTKRTSSDLSRCFSFKNKCIWIDIDNDYWQEKICDFSPSIIINSAWGGVNANNRDNWETQLENLNFQQSILDISKKINPRQIIGIGSQAEYGNFSGCIEESYPINPNSAYGAIKFAASLFLKTFSEANNLNWYWIRLFSCFGERESLEWLIPSTINKILKKEKLELTPGDQKYSYLYVKDFSKIISLLLKSNVPSGIYNISGKDPIKIKDLLIKIRDIVDPDYKLYFGTLPYRDNQSMCVQGDMKKIHQFINTDYSDFDLSLKKTVEYYIKLFKR